MESPRLPRIDPVTFSALNTLDMFVARAPLSRQEHAEANKALQHLVQTVEMLQAALSNGQGGSGLGHDVFGVPGQGNGANRMSGVHQGAQPTTDETISAEAAEELFKKSRAQ